MIEWLRNLFGFTPRERTTRSPRQLSSGVTQLQLTELPNCRISTIRVDPFILAPERTYETLVIEHKEITPYTFEFDGEGLVPTGPHPPGPIPSATHDQALATHLWVVEAVKRGLDPYELVAARREVEAVGCT